MIEASEQSEIVNSTLEKTIKLDDLVENFPSDRGLVFRDEGNENLPNIYNALINETKKYKKWSVIIGPEGGFSEKERRTISSLSSCISVSLCKEFYGRTLQLRCTFYSIAIDNHNEPQPVLEFCLLNHWLIY